MKFVRNYLQILLPLLLGFVTYQFAFVPFLEPKTQTSPSRWTSHESTPSESGLKWWEHFFLEGSWQRNHPLVIERDQCILLYQQREQISDTRWRFRPLTIVIPQGNAAGGKRAIFIENPKGAEIQFKSAFDWASGNPPPVVNGQLMGDIKIYSPADETSSGGELLIETRDMRIDKRQVWTTEPIKMRLGNSYVEGRYLSIYMDRDLLSEEQKSPVANESPFSGLDYLELFYVDRVDMALKPGGFWPRSETPETALAPASASLKCGGTFVFQFHQSQATLKNGVHMEHKVEGLPTDTFDCHELKLTMGWPTATPGETGTNALASSNRWRVDRMEATGSPGRDIGDQSNWIRMMAPGMQSEAYGQHLVMDFIHGMITLSNALPGTAPRNSSRVFLKRESFQVSSPQVQFQNSALAHHAPKDGPRRLGWVVADGIGIAQMESPDDSWSLRWSKRLVIRPHEHRDLIMIEGGANASSTQRGRFIAENLNMWVLPVEGALAQRIAPFYASTKLPEFVPDVIQASGEVIATSNELHATVDTMTVRFHYPEFEPALAQRSPNPPTGAGSVQETNPVSFPRDESSGNLNLQPPAPRLTPPVLARPMNPPASAMATAPNAQPNPMHVVGKKLEADVLRRGNESEIDTMSLDGKFTLSRERLSENQGFPFEASGDSLTMQSEAPGVSNLSMVGQPARVTVGTGWIEANELQMSQSDQLFWIDHPGVLVVPVEAIRSQAPKSNPSEPSSTAPSLLTSTATRNNGTSNLESIRWESPPRLQWGERMTFDGKIARFGGGVTLDCRMKPDRDTVWHIMASASTMSLDLANRIPFKLPTTREKASKLGKRDDPELQIVRLEGEVDVKAVQTDALGNRISTENLVVPKIEFNVPTQTFVGLGPGQLWSRRFGNTGSMIPAMGSNTNGPNTNAGSTNGGGLNPQTGKGASALQCLHLTFLGRVEGAMQQRLISFYDKIDSLLGPIPTWESSIDVRNAEVLGPNQSRLLCDQLNLFDASELSYHQGRNGPKETAWELDALGNAQLASRTDSGDVVIDANRIGYAALEDSVRIEGTARRGATIRRIPLGNSNAPPDEFQVSSATMRLKTGQLDAQIRRFEGVLPQQFQPPGARPDPRPGSPPPNSNQNPNAPPALPSPRDFNPLQPRGPGR